MPATSRRNAWNDSSFTALIQSGEWQPRLRTGGPKTEGERPHSNPKTRGQGGQEEMPCLFWVKAEGCGGSTDSRAKGLPGRQPLHTDTGHLQLLSLNQIPASGISSAVPKYPGLWHAESSPQTHPPFPSFILLSLLLPASPSCPVWSSPAAGNCSAVIFRVLQVALLICFTVSSLPHICHFPCL